MASVNSLSSTFYFCNPCFNLRWKFAKYFRKFHSFQCKALIFRKLQWLLLRLLLLLVILRSVEATYPNEVTVGRNFLKRMINCRKEKWQIRLFWELISYFWKDNRNQFHCSKSKNYFVTNLIIINNGKSHLQN